MRRLLPLLLLAASACSSVRVTPVVPPPAPVPAPAPAPAPTVEAPKPPATREEVRALWRRPAPESVALLSAVVAGADAALAEEAVFGLGQLGLSEKVEDARRLEAAAALRPLAAGPGAGQAAAVEALGKTGAPEDEALLGSLSRDPSARVRGEAALALFRLRHLKRIPAYSSAAVTALAALARDPDGETRWRAAYAASRWPERELVEPLKGLLLRDPDPRARLFAARALGQLKAEAPAQALRAAARDRDPQVRREAVWALAQASVTVPSAADDVSPHVRAAAAGGLHRPEDARLLRRLLADPSTLVRAEAVGSLARIEPGSELLLAKAAREHWFVRARALSELGPSARAALEAAVDDPDPRVASAAVEAAARSTEPWTNDLLDRVLRDRSRPLETFGAAVDAAKERGAALFPALAEAWEHPARANPEVSEALAAALKAAFEKEPGLKTPEWEARLSSPPAVAYWGDGREVPSGPARSVVLVTERGEIELQLAPEEAPVHAARFLESVAGGLYSGTIFHRVVSDFVVQGGDPRGSGWGDAGFTLRDEVGRLRFDRGVLGMPKAGPDTGGCQLFITHVPTPHLDGRYTAFGRVTRGLPVVDALQPGDRIERAYVKP